MYKSIRIIMPERSFLEFEKLIEEQEKKLGTSLHPLSNEIMDINIITENNERYLGWNWIDREYWTVLQRGLCQLFQKSSPNSIEYPYFYIRIGEEMRDWVEELYDPNKEIKTKLPTVAISDTISV